MLEQLVIHVRREQHQVPPSVVLRVVIDMVNYFLPKQGASNLDRHDQTMLHDVPVLPSHRQEPRRTPNVLDELVVPLLLEVGHAALPGRVARSHHLQSERCSRRGCPRGSTFVRVRPPFRTAKDPVALAGAHRLPDALQVTEVPPHLLSAHRARDEPPLAFRQRLRRTKRRRPTRRSAVPIPDGLLLRSAREGLGASLTRLPERVHTLRVPVRLLPRLGTRTFRLVQQGSGGFGRRSGRYGRTGYGRPCRRRRTGRSLGWVARRRFHARHRSRVRDVRKWHYANAPTGRPPGSPYPLTDSRSSSSARRGSRTRRPPERTRDGGTSSSLRRRARVLQA